MMRYLINHIGTVTEEHPVLALIAAALGVAVAVLAIHHGITLPGWHTA